MPNLKCIIYPTTPCNLQVLSQRSNGVKCRNKELEEGDNSDNEVEEDFVPEDEFVLLDDKIEEVTNTLMLSVGWRTVIVNSVLEGTTA